ncbi:MAG: type II secretion system F family protein [Candidatus Methylomirabilis sp.]|nr:type II secretion system F family protein [Candidatus Methylomirabilis sp.]
MEASDERAVVAWLRSNGYYPIKIGQAGAAADTGPGAARFQIRLTRGPSAQDVLAFTQQLATLLEAGMELDRSLAILVDLTDNQRFRSILRGILTDIQAGNAFADGLAKYPRLFSRLYINMVKAGEASGVLEVILTRLAGFLERSKAVRDEVTSALIYPILLLGVGGGAVMVMMNFVIPRFAQIFADTKQLMPLPTRMLLAISALTTSYWWLFAGLIILGWVGLRAYLQTEQGKTQWDQWKLALPILGRLIQEIEVSRFARTFGTLLQSGVPVLAAVSIVKETITNRVIAAAMSRLQEGGEAGRGDQRSAASRGRLSILCHPYGQGGGGDRTTRGNADTGSRHVRRARATDRQAPDLVAGAGPDPLSWAYRRVHCAVDAACHLQH